MNVCLMAELYLMASESYPLCKSARNSSLSEAHDRMDPSMLLVIVVLPTFCMPRMAMQRWEDSMTTPTPRGFSISKMASATCLVRRSCTWSLRENISAKRASLERPRTQRSGIYPMCICHAKSVLCDWAGCKGLYLSGEWNQVVFTE